MNKIPPKFILYLLIFNFLLILFWFLSTIYIEESRPYFFLLAIFGVTFLTLGILLATLSRKETGKLKKWYLVTGISATFPFIFSILHNFFYALAITFPNLALIFDPIHGISFIISLVIAPIVFIIGSIGSLFHLQGNKA